MRTLQRARKEIVMYKKLRARKSIKTPLGSTLVLYEIVIFVSESNSYSAQ